MIATTVFAVSWVVVTVFSIGWFANQSAPADQQQTTRTK